MIEKSQAELHARRRRPDESIPSLYTDIRRLISASYPNIPGIATEELGKVFFINALEEDMRNWIRGRGVGTLNNALRLALEYEGYALTKGLDKERKKEKRRRVKDDEETVRVVTTPTEALDEVKTALQAIKGECESLRKDYRSLKRENQDLQEENRRLIEKRNPSSFCQQSPLQLLSTSRNNGPTRNGSGSRMFNGRCYVCHQWGHRRRDCRELERKGRNVGGLQTEKSATVRKEEEKKTMETTEFHKCLGADVYITVEIDGKKRKAMLDTGCSRTVLPHKMLPRSVQVRPMTEVSIAANNSEVQMDGEADLTFVVGSQRHTLTVWLSKQIDEFLLGYDWLSRINCVWNFKQHELTINGEVIPLSTRTNLLQERHLFCAVDMEVPANCQTFIQVKSRIAHMLSNEGVEGWVSEPIQLRRDVVTGRTALRDTNGDARILIANLSDHVVRVKAGTFLGKAHKVVEKETVNRLRDANEYSTSYLAIERDGPPHTAVKLEPITERCKWDNMLITDNTIASSGNDNVVNGTLAVDKKPIDKTVLLEENPHLRKMIEQLPTELTTEQRQEALDLVSDFLGSFSKSEFDIGRTDLIPHSIDTGNHRPIKEQLRRFPLAHLEFLDAHVDKMLEHKIIEPSNSPWASNLVLVTKKNGDLRVCVDYRRLNSLTVKDAYPVPRVESCLDVLGGSCWYSTFDLRSGYWQCSIKPQDRCKTAFITRKGLFQFCVLPFGLCNAVSLFQRLQDQILAGLNWFVCLVYLDDIAVFGTSFEQHAERLRAVMERIKEAGLKFNPDKCRLFQRRIEFLGYVIGEEGVTPDPAKVQAVVDWPSPSNVTEVRGFLGLAGYYRRWVNKI
jgi:predicted aspartyl protease